VHDPLPGLFLFAVAEHQNHNYKDNNEEQAGQQWQNDEEWVRGRTREDLDLNQLSVGRIHWTVYLWVRRSVRLWGVTVTLSFSLCTALQSSSMTPTACAVSPPVVRPHLTLCLVLVFMRQNMWVHTIPNCSVCRGSTLPMSCGSPVVCSEMGCGVFVTAMAHQVVGKDGEVELALCWLNISSLYQEDKRIIERCGWCMASSCCECGFIIVDLAVAVTEGLFNCNSALHNISECK